MTLKFLLSATLFVLTGATLCRAALTVGERLRCGHYQEIIQDAKQPHDSEWAFARFFLVPDKATYEAAFKAAQKGDPLGKFILLRCHRDGAGVRQDMTVFWRINAELRSLLANMEDLPPVGSYMLSYLFEADLMGRVHDAKKTGGAGEASKVAGKTSREHLLDAAEGGFTQAMSEVGMRLQKEYPQRALVWYQKAADLGLAEGIRNVAYMTAKGTGLLEKNEAEAVRLMRKAAELGDVDAMMNMVGFYELMHLPTVPEAEAIGWINKAEATGHPLGLVEKAAALLRGVHGFNADKALGIPVLQKAAATGNAYVLEQVAYFYSEGLGLDKNPKKAAEFGKAAWSQGGVGALGIIDAAFQQDKDLAANKAEAAYWRTLAAGASPLAVAELNNKNPDIVKAIDAIDPFVLKVE